MLPFLVPLLSTLAANGMGLLSSAIQAKGKEFIEEKIGVKIPDNPTPADIVALKKAEMQHEEVLQGFAVEMALAELEAEKAASVQVTDRWKADMMSDSWLSKNVRPLVLVFLIALFTIFAIVSAFGVGIAEAYVELLGQMLLLVMSAYFIGRSAEKGVSMAMKGKK